MKTSSLIRHFIVPAIGILLTAIPLQAEVYFTENFDYTVGNSINGVHGGTGFAASSSWTMHSGTENLATVSGTGLSYNLGGTILSVDQSLHIKGTSATDKDFAYYKLSTSYNVDEFYVSFLVSASGWVPTGGQIGISLANATTAMNYQTVTAGQGSAGARWQTAVGAGSLAADFSGTGLDETHLVIVRFYKDQTTYFNKASIWVDPTSTIQGAPDATADVGSGRISSFLYLNIIDFGSGTADFNIGRIVGASTWNDVLSIPEPGTLTLGLGGAAVCLLGFRARRRQSLVASME